MGDGRWATRERTGQGGGRNDEMTNERRRTHTANDDAAVVDEATERREEIKGLPYLWEPGDTAAADGKVAAEGEDEVIEVEGSRASLSPADVRSAMPKLPTTPSGGQRAGAGRRGRRCSGVGRSFSRGREIRADGECAEGGGRLAGRAMLGQQGRTGEWGEESLELEVVCGRGKSRGWWWLALGA